MGNVYLRFRASALKYFAGEWGYSCDREHTSTGLQSGYNGLVMGMLSCTSELQNTSTVNGGKLTPPNIAHAPNNDNILGILSGAKFPPSTVGYAATTYPKHLRLHI